MSKRRGGSLPRVMPRRATSGLDIRMVMPGLPIVAPDPLAVSLGGSETAGLQLAAELVRQGHRVTVACDTPAPFGWQGVRLQRGLSAVEVAEPCDLFLVLRDSDCLRYGGAARARFLWSYDLPPTSVEAWPCAPASLADRMLFVSQWQADQYRALAPSLADRFAVLRNGIDLELIAEATAGVERDPFHIAYVSRPERGLEVLLQAILPRLLAEEPRARLSIASYAGRLPLMTAREPHFRHLANGFGDAVTWHEPLGKRDLYRLLARAGLALYPTPAPGNPDFAETSCIVAMEAMACGAAWISTDAGALPETVGDAGVLVPLGEAGHAGGREAVEAMAAAALRVMREPDHAAQLRAAGQARAAGLGWGPIAEQLAELARNAIARSVPAPAVTRTKGRVALATPVYGHLMHSACTRSLLQTAARLHDDGYAVSWLTNSVSSIRHARNELAARFLAMSDATHIMWVDADLSFPGDAVSRLLAHDLDLIGALYPLKHLPLEFPWHVAVDQRGSTPRLPSGAVGAAEVPGGFVLVKREVYLALMEAFPDCAVPRSPRQAADSRLVPWSFDFYPEYIEDGFVVPEDYGFCRAWRSIGGTVWADLSIRLTHYGMIGYAGDPMSLVAPDVEPVGEAG